MLVLTDNATEVIHALVDRPELPDTAGLRITSAHEGPEPLRIVPAETPEEGDEVIDERGARVFLEPEAAALVDGRVLDARVAVDGAVQFSFVNQ